MRNKKQPYDLNNYSPNRRRANPYDLSSSSLVIKQSQPKYTSSRRYSHIEVCETTVSGMAADIGTKTVEGMAADYPDHILSQPKCTDLSQLEKCDLCLIAAGSCRACYDSERDR